MNETGGLGMAPIVLRLVVACGRRERAADSQQPTANAVARLTYDAARRDLCLCDAAFIF
jgi:hypothetical protein